ncbi:MAG TPA: hypothetical protein VME22_23790 [Solirubrobacteraceae bacterium]|nr:hypothetical protein [Solirubrobacteraceae bacterium]
MLIIALLVPIVFQVKQSLSGTIRFLPYGELSAAALALGGSPPHYGPQLETAVAGVVMLGWVALLAALGATRFIAQDV